MKALLAVFAAALLGVGAYWMLFRDSAAPQEAGAPGPPGRGGGAVTVAVEAAARSPVVEVIEAVGTARANESVTVTAKVTDTVRSVEFDDGDYVDAGDVLVQLTNAEESALLAEARANLEDARRQLERAENLGAQGLLPKSNVDEAAAREAALAARLETIVARLDDRLIRAPFAGLLGFRQVSPGTLVTSTTPIVTLDDVSTIKVDFTVPEVSLSRVSQGDVVETASASWPERTFRGTVQTIGTRIDPVTRAVSVRAVVPNADGALRPGMLLIVKLQSDRRDAVTIPERSIDPVRDQSFVYVVEDGRAMRREISAGVRRDGRVEVIDGVAVGDRVVTDGLVKLRDGAPVSVAGAAPDSESLVNRRDDSAQAQGG